MNLELSSKQALPTQRAITCGRLVFFFVGFVLMGIPIALAYGGVELRDPLEWLVLGTGIVIILLGIVLPPKIVAHAGFNLPYFLPSHRLPDIDADD